MKRIQNRLAESRYALPFVAVVAVAVYLAAGLFTHNLWAEFGMLILATYLMAVSYTHLTLPTT